MIRLSKFELYQGSDGLYYWRLRASNGRVVATGAEGYSDRRKAIRGIEICQETTVKTAILDVDGR